MKRRLVTIDREIEVEVEKDTQRERERDNYWMIRSERSKGARLIVTRLRDITKKMSHDSRGHKI